MPGSKDQPKRGRGRPSLYKPEYPEQAKKLCELGATEADLAEFFKVTTVTIWRWACEFSEFCNAIKIGKAPADDRVERSLYHRAVGYTFDAVKILVVAGKVVKVPYKEHVPPDVGAMAIWLKNRRSADWKDRKAEDPMMGSGAATILVKGGLPD